MAIRPTLVVVALFVVVGLVAAQRDFAAIVTNLGSLQYPTGGFVSESGEPTLKATSDAIFLTKLYGIEERINAEAVPGYIRTCEQNDGGYGGSSQAVQSDIESTNFAVASFINLGLEVPNKEEISRFIFSLKDASTGLVAPYRGGAPSVKATALALETLALLGDFEQFADAIDGSLSSALEAASNGNNFHFGGASFADNFYGILAASFVEFDIDTDEFARFILQQQQPSGGFDSLMNSNHAAQSLHVLNRMGGKRYTSAIDARSLRSSLAMIPYTIADASAAHKAMAAANFPELLKTRVSYEPTLTSPPIRGKTVIQGSSIRPTFAASAFGFTHNGLMVDVQYGEESVSLSLSGGRYTTDAPISFDNLGGVQFNYKVYLNIAEFGGLSFLLEDKLMVGYGIDVEATAVHEQSGRQIAAGEQVTVDTDFKFDVAITTADEQGLTSGDFDVKMKVLDASNVVIDEFVHNARTADEIEFTYTLATAALPSGGIVFAFSVISDSTEHSLEIVKYAFSVPMVATDIQFVGSESSEYQLGASGSVSMVPAAFPDMTTPVPLSAGARKFVMDTFTVSGLPTGSVAGKASGNAIVFDLDIDDSFDSIGSTAVSFRYENSAGEFVTLSNFDSDAEDLVDEPVTFTVVTDLQVTDVTAEPTQSNLEYGDVVEFSFTVKDQLSGLTVGAGRESRVFLLLNHGSDDAVFTSARQAATVAGGVVSINWAVDPNAVQGSGFLTVVVQDADGAQTVLKNANGDELRYDVEIGGSIDVDFNGQSISRLNARNTALVAQFSLSCAGKPLSGAKLTAELVSANGEEIILPVSADADGSYSASWIAPHKAAPSGEYSFRVFRDVDRVRAAEIDAAKEKEARKERRERELKGLSVEDVVIVPTEVAPLFERSIAHEMATRFTLPIRTQWLALFFFGFVFYRVYGIKPN